MPGDLAHAAAQGRIEHQPPHGFRQLFDIAGSELLVVLVVAIVVVGPKDMPKVLRRLGQWASKLRRMASEIRVQSGIDDVDHLKQVINQLRLSGTFTGTKTLMVLEHWSRARDER